MVTICAFVFQNGLTLTSQGERNVVYGTLFLVLADNLAAHQLGGYKVGIGFSLRKCRVCMATQADIQQKVDGFFFSFIIFHIYVIIVFGRTISL